MRKRLVFITVIAMLALLTACATTGKKGSVDRRLADVEKLANRPDQASFDKLVQYLSDTEESVRMAALDALAKRNDRRAAPSIASLLNDSSSQIREKAVETLGVLGNTETLPALIALFGNQDIQLARMSANAVRNFGAQAAPALISNLNAADQRVREMAIETLVLIEPAPIEAVAKALADPERAEGAKAVLVRSADKSLTALGVLALEADETVAVKIAEVIGQIGDPRGVDSLRMLAPHESAMVRAATATALGLAGKETARDLLVQMIADRDLAVRNAALEAIRPYSDKTAEAAIVKALKDPATQANAILALGHVKTAVSVKEILRFLKHKDPSLRRAAAESLGLSQEPKNSASLTGGLTDADPTVRMAAVRSLIQLDGPATPKTLKGYYVKSKNCGERYAIYDYLMSKGQADKLAAPSANTKDICSVCGACGTFQDPSDGKWYCEQHRPDKIKN